MGHLPKEVRANAISKISSVYVNRQPLKGVEGEEAKKIMMDSAAAVCGPIRVGEEIIKGNYNQGGNDQDDFEEIWREIKKYKTYTDVATQPTSLQQ